MTKKRNFRTLFIVGPGINGDLGEYCLINDDGYLMAAETYSTRQEARQFLVDENPDIKGLFANYLKDGFQICFPTAKQAGKLMTKNMKFADQEFEKAYIKEHGFERKDFKETEV